MVGFETNDDAGVFKIRDDLYLVQTVDFITPVVDDPYTFGRIAAINSLSDIYAMGAAPLTAMSVLMYNCDIDTDIIAQMMQGAADELGKVGCSLLGGHTVDDPEIKLGFGVTGTVTDGKFYKNCNLRQGDLIIYTKPLGIGILSTALKGELSDENDQSLLTETMLLSNYEASKILRRYDISSVTDVTGFGFAGHSFEMAKGAGLTIEIFNDSISLLGNAYKYSEMGIIPAGAYHNRQFLINDYQISDKAKKNEMIFFDPQTSGGLLIGVSQDDADALLKGLKNAGYLHSNIVGRATKFQKKYLNIL